MGHPGLSVQPLGSLNSVSASMPTTLDSPLKWIFLPVLPLFPFHFSTAREIFLQHNLTYPACAQKLSMAPSSPTGS